MPKCKNCGSQLSKLDNDICPVCGYVKPIEGVTSETIEITAQINLVNEDVAKVKTCNRLTIFFLFAFLGFTGIPYFYLKYKKIGFIYIILNVLLIGGLGSILAFLTSIGILWGYVITVLVSYLVSLFIGCYYLLKQNIKDGNGEFIR